MEGLKQQDFFSHGSGGQKSEISVSVDLVDAAFSLYLNTVFLLLCVLISSFIRTTVKLDRAHPQ